MKNACVIVNYNDADTTLSQIRRIRTFRNIDAVVVVDNCSTDDSVPRLKDAVSGNLFLVVSERNGGYGAGNNLGVRYASEILRAEHVLIANPFRAGKHPGHPGKCSRRSPCDAAPPLAL